MARPRTLSDDEIVARARSFFLERGYRAGTRELAAAIGLTWPALVARFGGKRALFARAIVDPLSKAGAFGMPADGVDLRELLERLSSMLQERWLMRLQYRLAAGSCARDNDSDALSGLLVRAVARCAKAGAAPRKLSGEELARLVTALLVGDAVQRFVRCQPTARAGSDLVGDLATLLVQASSIMQGADEPQPAAMSGADGLDLRARNCSRAVTTLPRSHARLEPTSERSSAPIDRASPLQDAFPPDCDQTATVF